jgi:hypothetical protein
MKSQSRSRPVNWRAARVARTRADRNRRINRAGAIPSAMRSETAARTSRCTASRHPSPHLEVVESAASGVAAVAEEPSPAAAAAAVLEAIPPAVRPAVAPRTWVRAARACAAVPLLAKCAGATVSASNTAIVVPTSHKRAAAHHLHHPVAVVDALHSFAGRRIPRLRTACLVTAIPRACSTETAARTR